MGIGTRHHETPIKRKSSNLGDKTAFNEKRLVDVPEINIKMGEGA